MSNSTTRKYISVDIHNNQSDQELHLTNADNQISGQIKTIDHKSNTLKDIRDIFFNKQDGQQIADSIKDQVKEQVKEELADEYLTVESANSKFAQKSEISELIGELPDLAKKSDLQGLVKQSELTEQMEDVVRTSDIQDVVRTDDIQDVVRTDGIKDFITEDNADEKYLPKADGRKFIPKSYVRGIRQIDITKQYNLEQAVNLLNELISALQGGGKVTIEDVEEIEDIEDGEYQTQEVGTALNSIISQLNDMGFEVEELSQNYDLQELAERLNDVISVLQDTPDFDVQTMDLTDGEYTIAELTSKLNEMIGALSGGQDYEETEN